MKVNNNFAALNAVNSNNSQQKKANPAFGAMTTVADDFIKAHKLFEDFSDKTAYNAIKTDPYVVLDFLPKMKHF